MTPDLTGLIERVEGSVGPDYELDCEIGCAVDDWSAHPTFGMAGNTYVLYRHKGLASQMPHYTASLDAVVSLIEAKRAELPDMSAADFLAAAIEEMMIRGWRPDEPNIPQICRAALAAALRAIQESRNADR